HAAQRAYAAIRETDPRAGDQVVHRTRHQDLTRSGERSDARADMQRNATQRTLVQLALAGMNPGPDLQPEPLYGRIGGQGAPDRARRTVERSDKAIAGGIHLATAQPFDLGADCAMGVTQDRQP